MSSASQVFRIMVVEDNEADVYLLRRALKKTGLGFELNVIDDGAQAIDFVQNPEEHSRHPIPDLAVLDLNLPKNTGIEVLEVIRRSTKFGNVPVVVVTSSALASDRAKAEELRIERFITKPPNLGDFLHVGTALKKVLLEGKARRPSTSWLLENGPRELEQLLRAIVCPPGRPVQTADEDRNCPEIITSSNISREKIVGRRMDDFEEPDFKGKGTEDGVLRLEGPAEIPWPVEYQGEMNVLPMPHRRVLRDITGVRTGGLLHGDRQQIPSWALGHAGMLFNEGGCVVAWNSGAASIYGYTGKEAIGQNASCFYSSEDTLKAKLQEEMKRSVAGGYFGNEGWQVRKDGSRFWANVMTMALRDEWGELRGFARVVRDFNDRHQKRLRCNRTGVRPISVKSTIAGVVSGEFDRVPEVNDTFLELLGYSREDLVNGRICWPDLTPPEYFGLDELAHEESLQFGACTPFEKELIRKDGTRVRVLIATAVLKLSPFQWITFVQDLRGRDRLESVDDEDDEGKHEFEEMVGNSAALRRVQRLIAVVAPTDANVLILGETGTGKELVARAIHQISSRKNLPFITLNCAAIPTGLLESELFGYERGAFTGALSQKMGRFELAHHGTLFLDEVGDIPLDLQPKLLRALQEKSFERLGGTKTIPIDVRLVAATNRDLTQMMGDKLFRSDLYYRLNVFPITTPALRDHSEDIPLLARHFTKKYAAKMSRQIDTIPSETIRALSEWSWPGNVRELENFIERAVILSSGLRLRAPLAEIRQATLPIASKNTLEQIEREHIIRVLRESGGVVTTAAVHLGLNRTTLHAMMRKLRISRQNL